MPDNAVAERFFGTLKQQRVNAVTYATHGQARSSLFEWIECWYNRRRLHSSLGYVSPEQFEAQLNGSPREPLILVYASSKQVQHP